MIFDFIKWNFFRWHFNFILIIAIECEWKNSFGQAQTEEKQTNLTEKQIMSLKLWPVKCKQQNVPPYKIFSFMKMNWFHSFIFIFVEIKSACVGKIGWIVVWLSSVSASKFLHLCAAVFSSSLHSFVWLVCNAVVVQYKWMNCNQKTVPTTNFYITYISAYKSIGWFGLVLRRDCALAHAHTCEHDRRNIWATRNAYCNQPSGEQKETEKYYVARRKNNNNRNHWN